MARQGRPRPQHTPARTPRVTPLSRGASTFPFQIPPPKGSGVVEEEAQLYSQTSTVGSGGGRSQFRGDPSVAAARMRGVAIDESDLAYDDEPDPLGEAEIVAPPSSDSDSENDSSEVARLRTALSNAIGRIQQLEKGPTTVTGSGGTPTPAARPQSHLVARATTIEDTDRLWDWIRADAASGIRFLGAQMKHSMALHETIKALIVAETHGVGLVRSIDLEIEGRAADHLGFVLLAPILATEQMAVAHVYLRPTLRASLGHYLPSLLQLAAQEMPGFKIAVIPNEPAIARLHRTLLLPLGFAEHTIFVR